MIPAERVPTHSHLPTAVGAPGVAGLYIDGSNNLAYGNPDDQQGAWHLCSAVARWDVAMLQVTIEVSRAKASLFDCRITPPGTSGSSYGIQYPAGRGLAHVEWQYGQSGGAGGESVFWQLLRVIGNGADRFAGKRWWPAG